MKETLNNDLIKAVKERLLEDRNIVVVLMEALSIGKEAVYRRLRGEVPFTFYEVVLIAKLMGLSLDEIAGNSVTNGALFSSNLQKTEDPFDYFYTICNSSRDIYTFIADDPKAMVSAAANALPFVFHSHYEMLTKFRLCRWLHQYPDIKIIKNMSNIHFPEKLMDLLFSLSDLLRQVPETCIIWDTNVFKALANDIKYFIDLNLMSEKDLSQIKTEFLDLLDEIEEAAYNGMYSNGNKLHVYISSINLESSYTYMEKTGFALSIFHLYAIDYIHSQHPDICKEQKRWIDSLKRYSTLISSCAEKQRLTFFKEQREMVYAL
ncbi:hypothetical protein D0T51_00945 [Parabacteroides sp. 52]|uniref:hypothetical protein n=1 Tax=unclassified Parabacteroides TaxID=2649774 RepID=UPI0013CF8569|nr:MULTISPECIES: hypothetical protein [unclassified Parabacteroides]MDH6533551.1 hypothetical protein [Parabacteroides sp. PM5-20]NDV54303.1 hypothetical protein [Parabacteroides sp. 52]